MSIYDFEVTKADGTTYSLNDYQGKVLLIVNTASKCGLAPQFEGLEDLYQTYKEQGFTVLGFPSNQFKQELADSEKAEEFCRLDYGVTFPMHQLVSLKGEAIDPLFNYLITEVPGSVGKGIKWNFTKFLINREGNVIQRFAPTTTPEKISPEIEKIL